MTRVKSVVAVRVQVGLDTRSSRTRSLCGANPGVAGIEEPADVRGVLKCTDTPFRVPHTVLGRTRILVAIPTVTESPLSRRASVGRHEATRKSRNIRERQMDTTTLFVIVLVVLLLGGGGYFYRRRV
jgi:hypothetical protein